MLHLQTKALAELLPSFYVGTVMQVNFTFKMGILQTQLEHDCKICILLRCYSIFVLLFNALYCLMGYHLSECGCVFV